MLVGLEQGYLVRPRMFVPSHLISSDPDQPPDKPYHLTAPILDYTSASSSAKFVDDIWSVPTPCAPNQSLRRDLFLSDSSLHPDSSPVSHRINYHLSALLHPRYIVPFPHAPSLDITLPSSHTLESHLSDASLTRAEANNEMLAYGSDAWVAEVESPFAEEREADQLDWYLPEGETSEMGREETEPEWEGRLVVSWRVVGRWCVGWELRAKWGRWVGW